MDEKPYTHHNLTAYLALAAMISLVALALWLLNRYGATQITLLACGLIVIGLIVLHGVVVMNEQEIEKAGETEGE